MDSPSFIIAGDIKIPEGVTQVNLITPLSRYDFVTLDLSEDDDTLLVRRVSPDELATFTGTSDPLPQEHWFVGLAWAWDISFKNHFKENRKN